MNRIILRRLSTAAILIIALVPVPSDAQWSTTHDQFYLPGSFNWQFRRTYPVADRLFNAFDYGHAILYERLWSNPSGAVRELETDQFNFITRKLLVNPPNLPLEEGAIEVAYAKIAPEAKMMFEWAHLLHRQIYDVLADERLTMPQKDAKVQELIAYYKSRKDLAFSSKPKSMELMEGQPYSTAFRRNYPKFNGLIWAYHWLQIGLYEPLLAGRNKDERQTGVLATVTRFRQMIEQPPTWMPRVMPMTPAVAPLFTARYPEAAIIFDNLHSMHDVISDILANPSVSRDQKRAEILKAAKRYRDNTSFVESPDEWREMATMMGVENMGGPVRGFLPSFPTPTVARGATMKEAMADMQHGTTQPAAGSSMPGISHSTTSPSSAPMAGMDHSSMAPAPAPMAGMDHSKMSMPAAGQHDAMHSRMTGDNTSAMSRLHARMMADPVIRARVESDATLHRLMMEAMTPTKKPVAKSSSASKKPAARRPTATTTKKTTIKKPTTTKKAAPAAKPKPKVDPHAGMDHSKMNMPMKK